MTTVLLVDDHHLVRAGLATLLDSTADLKVVGQAADGRQALAMVAEHHPDVVLMDLSMPVMDGVEATRRLATQSPGTSVVVLTSFSDRERVQEALAAGAIGYLLKDCEPGDLLAAVRAAAQGHAPLDPRVARALLPATGPVAGAGGAPARHAPAAAGASGAPGATTGTFVPVGSAGPRAGDELSDRERQVLLLVARGMANKQIARQLGITESTVKVHLGNVFKRIGVADRTSAALWAREHLDDVRG